MSSRPVALCLSGGTLVALLIWSVRRSTRTPSGGVDGVRPPIGFNTDVEQLQAACPSRRYGRCFGDEIRERYPVVQYRYVSSSRSVEQHSGPRIPDCGGTDLYARRKAAPSAQRATCTSPPSKFEQSRILLLLGVPSSPSTTGEQRRRAARGSWMQHETVGFEALGCFLLSSHTNGSAMVALRAEEAEHSDLIFVDAPETSWLITTPTKYSQYRKLGRGMPTFKQYAFFVHAARAWSGVKYIGKVDDDTAPNLPLLLPLLHRVRCAGGAAASAGATDAGQLDGRSDVGAGPKAKQPWAFIGAINWAAFVPRAEDFGIRGDRCGFGWSLQASLSNYGKSFGTAGAPGFIEACDKRGAVLPLPYGTGAGYIFSAALLKWVATSPAIAGWVREARGADHERLQWQKYEDTSTGYWLSYAPKKVLYLDIGPLVHDVSCAEDGARRRDRGGTYRPPANHSLLVHNLKHPPAFGFAWAHMQRGMPYNHSECQVQVHGAPAQLQPRGRQRRSPQQSGRMGRVARGGGLHRAARRARDDGVGAARSDEPTNGEAGRVQALLAVARAGDRDALARAPNKELKLALEALQRPRAGRKYELVERLLENH